MDVIKRIPFLFHQHVYREKETYITIGIQGGMTTREILWDREERIACNRAFFHIWSRYLCQSRQDIQLTRNVTATATMLSCVTDSDNCVDTLCRLLKAIFSMDYQEAAFLEAKEQAEKAFEDRYKSAEFRAHYKAMEITDMNKEFRLSEFIDELLKLDFTTFCKMAERFLTPGNIAVYVNGSFDVMTKEKEKAIEEQIPEEAHELQLLYRNSDPYLRQDAHLVELARENLNLTILYIDFLGKGTLFSRLVWLALAAQSIHHRNVEINLDEGDSSIAFSPLTLKEEKKAFAEGLSREAFPYMRKKLLRGYAELLENHPALWGEAVMAYILMGIDIVDLLEMIDKCSYELFWEIQENLEPKLTEIQLAFRREQREWQKYT